MKAELKNSVTDSSTFYFYLDNKIRGAVTINNIHRVSGLGHLNCNLWELSIIEAYRGNGYGNILMEKIEEICASKGKTKMTLWVYCSNKTAINMYKKHGFKIRETRGVGETFYVMSKKIKKV